MASSVLLGTRPDWTRSTLGIPIDTIVRIHPGAVGGEGETSRTGGEGPRGAWSSLGCWKLFMHLCCVPYPSVPP